MHIGIDLGGTKTEILVTDTHGNSVWRHRTPTPADGYEPILHCLTDLVDVADQRAGACCTVGVGIPGSISPHSGLVRNANTTCLNGQPLARDLSQRLSRVVRVENDANCFTLSEAVDGAGADHELVFGVIIGTGTGGGLVYRQAILGGHGGIAGEWGHMALPSPSDEERSGPKCWCGRRGCMETWISGPALSAHWRKQTGQTRSAEEIARAAEAGDVRCRAALEQYADRMARGLAVVINLIDPSLIVLGGGLSNISMLYQRLPTLWKPWVFTDQVTTQLAAAHHGDASGVRGAMWLGKLANPLTAS